jgi:pilus assembly protein Flp/PilA
MEVASQVLVVTRWEFFSHQLFELWGKKIMKELSMLLTRLWEEETGQDLVEYGLLLVLVALVAVAAMKTLSTAITGAFSNAAAGLTTATGGAGGN